MRACVDLVRLRLEVVPMWKTFLWCCGRVTIGRHATAQCAWDSNSLDGPEAEALTAPAAGPRVAYLNFEIALCKAGRSSAQPFTAPVFTSSQASPEASFSSESFSFRALRRALISP